MKLGGVDIANVNLGSVPVNSVYRGSDLVWSGAYVFQSAKAETYFAALEAAGFNEAQSILLYGLNFNQIKAAIDNRFVAIGNTILNKNFANYLHIGGTSPTHIINALNPGTFNLIPVGGIIYNNSGSKLNGTDGFFRTGIIPSIYLTLNNVHLAVNILENDISITKIYFGCENNINQNLRLQGFASTANSFQAYTNTVRTTGTTIQTNGRICGSRTATNSQKIFFNGVEEGNIITNSITQPTIELYLGARNNAGVAANFCPFTFRGDSAGLGLSAAEEAIITAADLTMNNALGR